MQKNTKKKIAPVVVAVLVVAYVGPLVAMISYAAGLLGAEAGGWGVLPFLLLYAAVGGAVIVAGFLGALEGLAVAPFFLLYAFAGGAVIVGVLAALAQRLREIDGGEEDEASKY